MAELKTPQPYTLHIVRNDPSCVREGEDATLTIEANSFYLVAFDPNGKEDTTASLIQGDINVSGWAKAICRLPAKLRDALLSEMLRAALERRKQSSVVEATP